MSLSRGTALVGRKNKGAMPLSWACAGLMSLVLGLNSGRVSAQETKYFGVFVGQDDGGRSARRLLYAEDDARRMKDVLERLGSLSSANSTLLFATSRSQVLATLARVGAQVQDARVKGLRTALTFYYSGHADKDGLRLGNTLLSLDELKLALKGSGADVRLVLLDACQSGKATEDETLQSRRGEIGNPERAKGGTKAPTFLVQLDDGDHLNGEAVITSSAADEASQESDRVGGGYFTHHLVAGLMGAADTSRDGQVSLDEAYHYAYHHTLFETADSAAGLQHPALQTRLQGYGQLILTRPDRAQTILAFPSGLEGHYLVFDRDRKRLVAELELGRTDEKRLSLPAGRYLIQKRAVDHLLTAEVTLTRGTLKRLDPNAMIRSTFAQDFSRGVAEANVQRALGSRFGASASLGYQMFFFQPEESLYPSLPLLGIELAWRPRRLESWSLTADVSVGKGQDSIDAFYEIPVTYSVTQLGMGLKYRLEFQGIDSERFKLSLGPHLSWLNVSRSFPGTEEPPERSYTTAPGMVVDVSTQVTRMFSVGLQGRAHYLLYSDGNQQLSLAHGELLVSGIVQF